MGFAHSPYFNLDDRKDWTIKKIVSMDSRPTAIIVVMI